MFCYKCGKELPDNAVFCNKCGNKVYKGEENEQAVSTVSTDFDSPPINSNTEIEKELSETANSQYVMSPSVMGMIFKMCSEKST